MFFQYWKHYADTQRRIRWICTRRWQPFVVRHSFCRKMKLAVWRSHIRPARATLSACTRCSRAMMANDSNRIGCIGREHECSTGIHRSLSVFYCLYYCNTKMLFSDIYHDRWVFDVLHCIKVFRPKAIKCICSSVNVRIWWRKSHRRQFCWHRWEPVSVATQASIGRYKHFNASFLYCCYNIILL